MKFCNKTCLTKK